MKDSASYKGTAEYRMISEFYGDRVAVRSQVPLMNHIVEGMQFMYGRGASDYAIRAYIVHPLFQGDAELRRMALADLILDPHVVLRAMEYRRAANAYLCTLRTDDWDLDTIRKEVGLLLPDVHEMLMADKWQNNKDFLKHHYGTHPRSEQLRRYFENWIEFLETYGDG